MSTFAVVMQTTQQLTPLVLSTVMAVPTYAAIFVECKYGLEDWWWLFWGC